MPWPAEGQPVEHLRFDGMWRPEPWRGSWCSVRYHVEHQQGSPVVGFRTMDVASYRSEELAQARCDELNAARMADSAPAAAPGRLI